MKKIFKFFIRSRQAGTCPHCGKKTWWDSDTCDNCGREFK